MALLNKACAKLIFVLSFSDGPGGAVFTLWILINSKQGPSRESEEEVEMKGWKKKGKERGRWRKEYVCVCAWKREKERKERNKEKEQKSNGKLYIVLIRSWHWLLHTLLMKRCVLEEYPKAFLQTQKTYSSVSVG